LQNPGRLLQTQRGLIRLLRRPDLLIGLPTGTLGLLSSATARRPQA
jgi:hypothetical protein